MRRMKLKKIVLTTVLLSFFGFQFVSAKSSQIESAHRTCQTNADCLLVTIGCGCVHNSTCGRADDANNGIIDVVNKSYRQKYEGLSKCSAAETKGCAMAGACANQGQWVAQCERQSCSLQFHMLCRRYGTFTCASNKSKKLAEEILIC